MRDEKVTFFQGLLSHFRLLFRLKARRALSGTNHTSQVPMRIGCYGKRRKTFHS